jgi:hypothetical protein
VQAAQCYQAKWKEHVDKILPQIFPRQALIYRPDGKRDLRRLREEQEDKIKQERKTGRQKN